MTFLRLLLIFILPFATRLSYGKEGAFAPQFQDFIETIEANEKSEKEAVELPIELGAVQYISVQSIFASQPEFTFLKVLKELKEAESAFGVRFSKKTKKFKLAYSKGRSAFPSSKTAFGILYKGHIYLVDGHHKVLVSLYFGAKALPVRVLDDWSSLSNAAFSKRMQDSRFAYSDKFYFFSELRDNPNLYLARLLIQKVKGTIELEQFNISSVQGAKKPLLLKYNEGIPFIEFYLADLMSRNGIYYKNKWGDKIPLKVRKKIKKLLEQDVIKKGSPLYGAILVSEQEPIESLSPRYNQLRARLIFDSWINKISCDEFIQPKIQISN